MRGVGFIQRKETKARNSDKSTAFFARASARPVRNRTEGRVQPLDRRDFAKEVFLALVCLWRKELNREGQAWPGIEVGYFHAKQSLMAAFGVVNINSTSLCPATNHQPE